MAAPASLRKTMEQQLCLACSVNPATSTSGTVPLCAECAAQALDNKRGVHFEEEAEEEAEEDDGIVNVRGG